MGNAERGREGKDASVMENSVLVEVQANIILERKLFRLITIARKQAEKRKRNISSGTPRRHRGAQIDGLP